MNLLVRTLMEAPEHELDASMKELISKWDEEPKAIQLLEVLDKCARYSLASGFTMQVLNTMLGRALEAEGIKYEELITQAHWRKEVE
jgi:hypothetical protein